MLISPLIDLLVISGSGFLFVGALLKAFDVATRYSPHILGLSSLDFLLMTGACWSFALVLAARTWVQLNEPLLTRTRRERMAQEEDWHAELDYEDQDGLETEESVSGVAAGER